MQRTLQYLGYVALRVTVCVLQSLSPAACEALADAFAVLMYDVLRVRRKLTEENLRQAYPQWTERRVRRTARAMWRHLMLLVVEVTHLPRKVHDTNWRDYVSLANERETVRALLSGRPVLLVTAHFGNFEMAGYTLGLLGFPTYTIARTLDNPYIDRFVNRFRAVTGQYIIPKKGGYDQMLEVAERGGVLAFLADQYAGVKGCWVDFFGRPASAHKAIGLLAIQHEALVAVGAARRIGGVLRYEMGMETVADVRSGQPHLQDVRRFTQWYTGQIETFVRRAPEQYWWLHRRWKDPRPPAKRARQAA